MSALPPKADTALFFPLPAGNRTDHLFRQRFPGVFQRPFFEWHRLVADSVMNCLDFVRSRFGRFCNTAIDERHATGTNHHPKDRNRVQPLIEKDVSEEGGHGRHQIEQACEPARRPSAISATEPNQKPPMISATIIAAQMTITVQVFRSFRSCASPRNTWE
jgi:hypothetical protein